MRRIEINNGDNPLGKFGDGDFNPNCYPDAVFMVNNLLEIIQVFVRELACSSGDGTITIDKIGNRMVLLAPDDPTAGFEIGEIGPRVQEADDAVRDAEREAGLDASGRDLSGGADQADDGGHRPRGLYDRMRDLAAQRRVEDAATEAQFPAREWHDGSPVPSSPMIAIGGECPICQTALISRPFDAELAPLLGSGHLPIELWAKKLTTRHMAYLGSHPMFRDELEDLRTQAGRLQQAALDGVRLMKAAEPSVVLESAYDAARPVADEVEDLDGTPPTTGPSSCGRSWDEAGSSADASAEPVGWTPGFVDPDFLKGCGLAAQEPQDAPNSAEQPLSADASETGSSASHAAPGGNPEDWRWVNPPEAPAPAEMASDVVEMERGVINLSEMPHMRFPEPGDQVSWRDLSGVLVDGTVVGVSGHRENLVGWGIDPTPVGPGQSNATFTGRFPAVDISGPIKD